jgi:hypothetical protein
MTRSRLIATRLALVLGATLLTANYAAAQKVTTNYDTSLDFAKYKTYKWVTIQGAAYPNQLQDMMIRNAVDSTLAMKGMVKDTVNPTVFVAYQLSVTQSTQYNTFGTGGYGWGWGGGMQTTTPQTIHNGELVIDLYDPGMKQLVWQSTATKQLNPSSNAEKNQQNLQKAVNKMFEKYPPGAKK